MFRNRKYNDGIRTGYMLAIKQLSAAHDMIFENVLNIPPEHNDVVVHMLTMMDTLEATSEDFREYFTHHLRDL